MRTRIIALTAALALAVSGAGATSALAGQGITNTAGGGNCSIWAKMKSAIYGVDCTFYMP